MGSNVPSDARPGGLVSSCKHIATSCSLIPIVVEAERGVTPWYWTALLLGDNDCERHSTGSEPESGCWERT